MLENWNLVLYSVAGGIEDALKTENEIAFDGTIKARGFSGTARNLRSGPRGERRRREGWTITIASIVLKPCMLHNRICVYIHYMSVYVHGNYIYTILYYYIWTRRRGVMAERRTGTNRRGCLRDVFRRACCVIVATVFDESTYHVLPFTQNPTRTPHTIIHNNITYGAIRKSSLPSCPSYNQLLVIQCIGFMITLYCIPRSPTVYG